MQDEVNTKVVAIMIKGGKISAEVLKKALDKFVQEIEKAQKQMQQPKTYRGKQSIKHLMSQNAAISNIEVTDGNKWVIIVAHPLHVIIDYTLQFLVRQVLQVLWRE